MGAKYPVLGPSKQPRLVFMHLRRARAVDPWFRSHPAVAIGVTIGSFGVVLGLAFADPKASDAIALLYVLPIALCAMTWGLRGGLLSAAGAYGSFCVFAVAEQSGHVGPDGWLTRAAALFLLGGLLGRASDQSAQAGRMALEHQQERLELAEENRRFSEGLELSDSILQHVAVAKWLIEQGSDDEAAKLLTEALDRGGRMVADLLPLRSVADHASMKSESPKD
jgi:hypothetical protein